MKQINAVDSAIIFALNTVDVDKLVPLFAKFGYTADEISLDTAKSAWEEHGDDFIVPFAEMTQEVLNDNERMAEIKRHYCSICRGDGGQKNDSSSNSPAKAPKAEETEENSDETSPSTEKSTSPSTEKSLSDKMDDATTIYKGIMEMISLGGKTYASVKGSVSGNSTSNSSSSSKSGNDSQKQDKKNNSYTGWIIGGVVVLALVVVCVVVAIKKK